jgi:hypothetical protein
VNELALFAGVGGGILGGHLLGWRTICAVEHDPYAASVLAARQNDGTLHPFPIWDDVCTFDGRPWRGAVDVISGGFPCQDISAAGKGAGLAGERSGLWREFARIIAEVAPPWSSSKTARSCAPEDLTPCSKTLPAWGTMRHGVCLEQTTWAPRIAASVCGSWPTPVASEGKDCGSLWTALAPQDKGGRIQRRMASLGLPETLRTPRATLNPAWVEWLMGWPVEWTDCAPLATDKYLLWRQLHGLN